MHARTRRGIIVGAVALTLFASACGGGGGDGEEEPGTSGPAGTITVRGGEPENPLIPTNTNETNGGDVLDVLFSKLVRYNVETAAPENDVAESIESSDNKAWTIKIKQGWKFHDGTEVKAHNFVDAWNYGAYGPNAQLNSYFFEPIAGYAELNPEDPDGDGPQTAPTPPTDKLSGLKVVDDYTFEVTLSEPASAFPQRLGYTAFSPLPDKFFEDPEAFGQAPIGNGPYKFKEWQHNAQIVLEAFADYTGDDKGKVQEIVFKHYTDLDAAYADLLDNNLDILDTIPDSALAGETYKSDLGDRAVEEPQGAFGSITFPMYRKEYQNVDLRHAVSMAIDRPLIMKNIFNNQRIPADGWVSPVVDGYKPGQCGEWCTYNPEKAKELFQKSGFTGKLAIGYNADGGHKGWIEATCNSIKNALGVDCVATPTPDFATWRANVNAHKVPYMMRGGWLMDYPSIENFLVPLYATNASSNDGLYSSAKFDDLVKRAASASGDEAIELYQEAERVLADDMPVIPMYYYKTVAGYSENVDNVAITPFGRADLTSVTVK